MKKTALILTLLSIFAFSNSFSQSGNNGSTGSLSSGNEATVVWDKKTHEFGTLKQGEPQTAIFKMTNKGGKPIIITNAEGSCGCTNIEYPKQPIKPGETISIKAIYDAEELGEFNKTVTLTMNIEESKQILYIKGQVKQ